MLNQSMMNNKKNNLVQFISTSSQDFQQIIKLHFGQLIKSQSKQISSPTNNHYQILRYQLFLLNEISSLRYD